MKFSTKRGFTLREILIIIIVVSVGLLSVVIILTNSMNYVQKTRQKIVALNLAREGMEAVYQIRDTNRTRWSGSRDSCRLKIDPLHDAGNSGCNDDPRFSSGSYALQRLLTGGQEYFALTGIFVPLNLTDGLDSGDLNFSLCQQSGLWYSCIGDSSATSEGMYFRQITGRGLYFKDVSVTGGTEIDCSGGNALCTSSRAKEFRFCSTVSYIGNSTGEVQLCGVMTNFLGQ